MGVKAMNTMVKATNKTEKTPPKTNTFKRDNFKEKRSSKVFSFKTTNLYLSVSFCLSFTFFCFDVSNAFYLVFHKYTQRI